MQDIKIFLKKKKKKQGYGCKRYKIFADDEKQRLLEYRKILFNKVNKRFTIIGAHRFFYYYCLRHKDILITFKLFK